MQKPLTYPPNHHHLHYLSQLYCHQSIQDRHRPILTFHFVHHYLPAAHNSQLVPPQHILLQ